MYTYRAAGLKAMGVYISKSQAMTGICCKCWSALIYILDEVYEFDVFTGQHCFSPRLLATVCIMSSL